MFNSKPVPNYLADCISKLPPELQPAARQAVTDKQITPAILEAVTRHLEESAMAAAKVGANENAKALAEMTTVIRAMEKRLAEKDSGDAGKEKLLSGIAEAKENLENTRRDLRTLEDKVDTLVPYQLWKVAVVATLAFVVGAVASWNIRPVYKRWQYEQQQEGR